MEEKNKNTIYRIVLFSIALLLLVAPVMAATTQLHIVKYANDGTTILNETTKTYQWLEANLPVLGDGTTHYYSQGPTFNDSNLWDDVELLNIETRDWGAVKGTDLKDICNLVGGMSAGETVKVKASDGFSKTFPYAYVFTPDLRQGPMGITWYRSDQGYVSSYTDGMRLVMFADAKTNTYGWNASGLHVFGNADMRDCWAPNYWYNYSGIYPSSGGVSVKLVSEIIINSNQAPPVSPRAAFISDKQSGTIPLTVQFTDQSTGTSPHTYAWDFNNDGIVDSTIQSPSHTYSSAGTYTVNLTVTNSAGSDSELKTDFITVNPLPIDEWSISLNGQVNEQLTRVNFESLGSGNRLNVTDASGTWSGIALWRILARVDDTDPTTFSDTAADLGYNVTVASDGFSRVFNSSFLKRNDNVIVADTLNGAPLPKLDGTKKVWPLKIVGSVPTSGHKVSNITQITLSDFVVPPAAPVAAFEAVPLSGTAPLAVTFTDKSTGTGPLTYAWDFDNDGTVDTTLQNPSMIYSGAGTYTVNLTVTNGVGVDSEVKTGYISVTSLPVIDEWSITLSGVGTEQLTRVNFESLGSGNRLNVTDASGTWSGIALWRILARVDDTDPTTFSDTAADLGYNVTVASDGFSRVFNSSFLKRNDNVIVADTLNGAPLPKLDGTKKVWPLKIVGSVPTSGHKVSNITQITLSDFVVPPAAPVAAFEAVPLSGTAPLAVTFTDKSTGTGPLTYAWDFDNDGTVDTTLQNPSMIYSGAGTYTVNLTVTNGVGVDSEVKTGYISVTSVPLVDTLFDGTVNLTPGETFTKNAYNNITNVYTINRTTPLGALDKVASLQGIAYNVTDSRWIYDTVLLLDDIGQYRYKKPNIWYAYVNGVYKDGYQDHPNGLNVIELNTNDQVNFYYAPNKDPNPVVNATAVVKIKINIQAPGPVVDTLFDGMITLTPGETFTKNAYNNVTNVYTINRTTPLGALDKVASLQGIAYNVTDSRWIYDTVLLLDDIGQYRYKKPNIWYAYVNGVYKDGYLNHPNGLNVIELNTNDQVNFYYAPNKDPNPVVNATAVIRIKVDIGGTQPTEPEWSLSLNGAKTTSVSKTFFEQGLACPASGHQKFWTDTDGNIWGGVPLWVLVAMVDDNPDVGPDHFNFNESIAAQGYSVKVSSGDGWDTTLSSQNIARNNSILVVNTLNGQPLPTNLTSGKLSWPLHLKGAAVFGGQQVGNITKIELTGLPQPPTEWKLTLQGDVTDTITQSYFMDAIACRHNVTWTDSSNNVWQGVALWDLAGAVDDVESSNHFTFNDTRATMGYTIRVFAADGFNATFGSAAAAHNNGYIVAYKLNGAPLTGSDAPLKLVGPATVSGKERVGGIVKISLEGLPDQSPAGDWQLIMNGKITDTIPQSEFEYSANCHSATYTDINGNVYTGMPLWRLLGWVDDRIPHGPDGFNDAAAIAGYKVIVKAGDGYAKEFTSSQIGKTNAFIVANTMNGAPLPTDGSHPPYPLRLVGTGATGGNSVGNIVEIQLTDFQTPVDVPKLHIIKYGSDGTTVINETYVDYTYMENTMPVIGDGVTAYRFEGLTLNPSNLWDPEETYPGGFKVSNVVKGTRVHDLAELVGGMGAGTAITFVASDGFETTLPYSSIYTNPAVQARQGDAIIAWWGDGQYVPDYADGMRLFFTPGGDHVYGQWDMHETLPSQYWRYNFQDGVQYPSAAGLSAKYITTIKVLSSPESDWTLDLDGRAIGGLNYTVAKPFLEEAIACQFGSDHKATYTDSKGRVWEGMPLWFFAGFVDDADQHSANSFNVSLAQGGYNIIITGSDGFNTTIDSRQTIRSSKYIIANSLNGTHIADSDESWPLRLTGENITGAMTVKGVKSIRLVPILQAPVAAFDAAPLSGTAPLAVQFTDTSTGTGPLTYTWDFNNDGLTDNTTQSPSFTYSAAGTYTVNLTVTNSAGSDSEVRTGYITVNPVPVIDEWSISLNGIGSEQLTRETFESLAAGNRLTYTDASGTWSGIALWRLLARVDDADSTTFSDTAANFGYNVTVLASDGYSKVFTSSLLNRNDNFIVADTLNGTPLPKLDGTKKVWPLKIVGSVPTSGQKVGNITQITLGDFVAPPTAPVAAFEAIPLSGTAPLVVTFTDKSTGTGPLSYAWDFNNDGITDNTTQSPSFTYSAAGTYTVNLTVTNSAGSDSEVRNGYIAVQGDNDGIPDAEEQGPGGTDPAYDGNGDGTPDNQQGNVASFNTTTGKYVTLVIPDGMHLTDVQAVSNPSPADIPAYLEMPIGFIDFTINGIAPGGSATAQLHLPTGTTVNTYYKYGKTPDNAIPHWYEFLYDGTTGAEIRENIITLHFVDGNRGDNDTIVNGIIIDPGVPGIDSRTQPTAAFTADPVTGTAPLLVQFADASTGTPPLTYAWDFNNDGITDNTTQSPSFTYSGAGVYTVNLTVTNAVGSNSLLRPDYITVRDPTHTPSITVTSPNGGETWQRGTSHTVTWDYSGSPGSRVKIILLKGGIEVGTISSGTSIGSGGHGSYTWPIYWSGSTGSDYKVKIQSLNQPNIKDTSNNNFIITKGTTASSITVTSPNGGETWQRGKTYPISWNYAGSPGSSVSIVLLKGGSHVLTIASSIPTGSGGSGSYSWKIPSDKPIGKDYQVRIQSTSKPTIKDTSNTFFSIVANTDSAGSITVTSPNGGETWQRGTSHTVTWDYSGSPGSRVKIILLKGGIEVGTISSSTSIGSGGHGSYTWLIYWSGSTGSDYKVKIQSISQPDIKDTSNDNFSLTPKTIAPSITVTSPNGGEKWQRGTSHTVTWDYSGSPGSRVKIILLKGGIEVGTISSSTSIGSGGHGSYTWPIYWSGSTGSDYKVKIQSLSQPNVKDLSNNYFTINQHR